MILSIVFCLITHFCRCETGRKLKEFLLVFSTSVVFLDTSCYTE